MPVEVLSRDERIFGGGKNKTKPKEPEPSAQLKLQMDHLDPSTSTAEDYKAVGNACVQAGLYTTSIKFYSAAIERDPENEVLYSNRSAAYLQSTLLSGPSSALKDAQKAIALKPSWFKGYLRKADALFAVGKFVEAVNAYNECLKLNPDCSTAVESRKLCEAERDRAEGKEEVQPPLDAGEGPGVSHPKTSPNKHHEKAQAATSKKERENIEENMSAEQLLQSWSKDTDIGGSGKTGLKPRAVDLSNVDRGQGTQAKNSWLSDFRSKVAAHPEEAQRLQSQSKEKQLVGEGFDYKTKKSTGPGVQHEFENGTDSVGRAIQADAFKHEIGLGSTKSKWWV
jgi:tetratricopeptide (TPR) repeat protein